MRPFETPADVRGSSNSIVVASEPRRSSPRKRAAPLSTTSAIVVGLTPQVTPFTRPSRQSVVDDDDGGYDEYDADDNDDVPSPVVSRKRVPAVAAVPFGVGAPSSSASVKRARGGRAATDDAAESAWQQQQQQQYGGARAASQLDAAQQIVRDAVLHQMKVSGGKPWLTQLQADADEEFDRLRDQLDSATALSRRLAHLQQEIARERVHTVDAKREQASLDAKLRTANADLAQRRAVVERRAQLGAWLRQLQQLRDQAATASRVSVTHVAAPADRLRSARAARLAKAAQRAAATATASSQQ